MKIRRLRPDDASAAARLSEQLGFPAQPDEVSRRLVRVIASAQDEAYAAVLADGALAGWIHVFAALRLEARSFAELGGLVVDDRQRRCGVGQKLLSHAEAWATQQGLGLMRIRSRSSRFDAHAFCEHQGYTVSKQQHVFDKALK